MGKVYKPSHGRLDKLVVLKVLRPALLGDRDASSARFQREAQGRQPPQPPNSISVLDFGQAEDGALYIAMEFVAGQGPARARSRASGPLARGARRAASSPRCSSRARRGARARRHPPRPQAREHHARAAARRAGLREGARLRHREDRRHRRRGPALTRAGVVCGTPAT